MIKVEEILESKPNDWQGLTRTTFLSEGRSVYILNKAGNEPQPGDELDGTVAPDKSGKLKFTKTPMEGANRQAYTGPKGVAHTPAQKDEQRQSIERQSSLKAALELVRDAKANDISPSAYAAEVLDVASQLYTKLQQIGAPKAPDNLPTDAEVESLFKGEI